MAAWASSSLQSEAPSVSAIEAAADENGDMNYVTTLEYPKPSRTPSVISSMASSAASFLASASTSYSMSSWGSFASCLSSRSRRRGRRTLQTRQAPHVKTRLENTECESGIVFWCTFVNCNKRFTTHYEWARHEQSIHVPRQTWTCRLDDDPYSISYSCRDKDEQSRTFFRQDQFVQHLHAIHFSGLKHPSSNLGCSKGSSFGCAALVERWRRPAPTLEKHDPLLHCGFCGMWLSTWEERRSHVSQHYRIEKKQLSSWWELRAPNVLPDEQEAAVDRVRCQYCCRVFDRRRLHVTCQVWSCRFPPDRNYVQHDMVSLFVDNSWSSDQALLSFWESQDTSYFFHDEECEQEIYRTAEAFFQHLESSHKATASCRSHATIFEKYFFREVKAAFQPEHTNASSLTSSQYIPELALIPPPEPQT